MRRLTISFVAATLFVLTLGACKPKTPAASPADALKDIWCFAHLRKSAMPFGMARPPMYDIVDLSTDGKARLASNLDGWKQDAAFEKTDTQFTLSVRDPNRPDPVKTVLQYRFEKDGSRLVVSLGTEEWLYVRKADLLKNDVVGTWSEQGGQEPAAMTLSEDGRYLLVSGDEEVRGYFRLWHADFGNALTTSCVLPKHGVITLTFKYSRGGDTLTLTPVLEGGALSADGQTWTLNR